MESVANFFFASDAILYTESLVERGKCSDGDCFISKELDGRFHVYVTKEKDND